MGFQNSGKLLDSFYSLFYLAIQQKLHYLLILNRPYLILAHNFKHWLAILSSGQTMENNNFDTIENWNLGPQAGLKHIQFGRYLQISLRAEAQLGDCHNILSCLKCSTIVQGGKRKYPWSLVAKKSFGLHKLFFCKIMYWKNTFLRINLGLYAEWNSILEWPQIIREHLFSSSCSQRIRLTHSAVIRPRL